MNPIHSVIYMTVVGSGKIAPTIVWWLDGPEHLTLKNPYTDTVAKHQQILYVCILKAKVTYDF